MATSPIAKASSSQPQLPEESFVDSVKTSISNGIKYSSQVISRPEELQKAVCFCMESFKLLPKETALVSELNNTFVPYDDMTDAIGVFESANWLISGECIETLKQGRYASFTAKTSLLFAGMGSCTAIASYSLQLFDAGEAASAIGATRVFGYAAFRFVPQMSLVTFIRSTVAIGYAGNGIDAIQRLRQGENSKKCWREIAYCALQFVIKALVLTNLVINLKVIAALSTVAWGIGINNFLRNENQADDDAKKVAETKLKAVPLKVALPVPSKHNAAAAA